MKTIILICSLLLLCFNSIEAQVNMHVGVFRDSEAKAYVELFLKLEREWLNYKEMIGQKYVTDVPVVMSLYSEDALLFTDSFEVNSPLLNYPRDLFFNRQYNTPEEGDFTLKLECALSDSIHLTEHSFSIRPPERNMSLATPLLLANYGKTDKKSYPMVKGGYHLTLLHGSVKRNQKKIAVYSELYVHQASTEQHKKFVQLTIYDEKMNFLKSQVYNINSSYSSAQVFEFDISDLVSGKYVLKTELKSHPTGEVLDQHEIPFYRENPYLIGNADSIAHYLDQEFVAQLEEDELDYCLRAVVPIVPQKFSDRWAEVSRKGSATEKRALLMEYYIFLDHNNYFQEFLEYMEKVEFCNDQFESGFGYGFESDRGVIYLKYGPPNDQFQQEHESTAPPYEIWSYYELKATNQTDVKFVFYNPSLAPGNYILLHSTARGEVNNPRWKLDLYRNSPLDQMSNDINETNVRRQFTRRAGKNFTDF